MARKQTTDNGLHGYNSAQYRCSTCCPSRSCGTAFYAHRVIYADLGEGTRYYCTACFNKRIDALLAVAQPEPSVEVDANSVTLDGVEFVFPEE